MGTVELNINGLGDRSIETIHVEVGMKKKTNRHMRHMRDSKQVVKLCIAVIP